MPIHVNIGEAKTRLSELIAAALRGEEVILQKAGVPTARILPIDEAAKAEDIGARRRASFEERGIKYRHLQGSDETLVPPSLTDAEYEERLERKFGKPSS